jgi:hypothetical protein
MVHQDLDISLFFDEAFEEAWKEAKGRIFFDPFNII